LKFRVLFLISFLFSCLPVFFNGFLCTECQYVSKNRKNILSRFRVSHHYQNPRKRGERYKETGTFVPWKANISYQRFFFIPPKNTYFQVDSRVSFSDQARPKGVRSGLNIQDTLESGGAQRESQSAEDLG